MVTGILLKTSQIPSTNDTGFSLIAAIKIKGMSNRGVRKSWPTPQNCTTVQLPWIKHLCIVALFMTRLSSNQYAEGPPSHITNVTLLFLTWGFVVLISVILITLPTFIINSANQINILLRMKRQNLAEQKTQKQSRNEFRCYVCRVSLHFLLLVDHDAHVIQQRF